MPARSPTTRCWTLVAPTGALDVAVSARDDDRLGAVLPPLAAALRLPSAELWSGSTRLDDELPLSDPALAHGALLGLGRPGPRPAAAARSSALQLHVVGGPDAGTAVPLERGRHVVGRGGEATARLTDPDVSRRHLLVEVGTGDLTVRDLGSSNGSELDGVPLDGEPRPWPAGAPIRLGSSTLRTAGPGGARATLRPGDGGRLRLDPGPRLHPPREDVEVTFPAAPAAAPSRRLAWVAVALPAVGGVVLAWVLDAPHFLFFALLSPVVAVGTWLSDRWSGRRSSRRARATHAAELTAARDRLAAALRADERAAAAAHPDLAALTTAARRRSTDLWQRRRGDADALAVRIGTGPGESRVARVESDGPRRREPSDLLPVVVELAGTGGLGVAGPRAPAVGVLSAVLGQLAALHAPGEVELALLTTPDRLADWAWLRWLPHLAAEAVHVHPAPPADAADGDSLRWFAALLSRRAVAQDGAPGWVVVLVDRPVGARLLAALRTARSAGVVPLACGSSTADLPGLGEAVLQLGGETGGEAALLRSGAGRRSATAVDRLPRRVAAQLARDLAALAPATVDAALPRHVRLLDLPAARAVPAAAGAPSGGWSRARDTLVATLGRTATGDLSVDLCRHGPHALVAGTTGSGKSELLQTLIAGLALAHPPDRCSFLLVDYKGGAAFAEAAALPHTVGLLTDLAGAATARALRSLTAELTRRESLLAAHGVPDLGALPDAVELARLVIVVDEFAGLAEELPAFLSGLVGIAQRGRSLGVHLVLATQRPGGVVSPEIRANCTLRVCLRTTDEAESRDVLGSAQAAVLPVDTPGRGYLRAGGGAAVLFQAARVGGAPLDVRDGGPQVARWRWPAPPAPPAEGEPAGRSDLAVLTEALVRRAGETGLPLPHRPWRPALPDRLTAEELEHLESRPAAVDRLRLGLLDRPDVQAQEPVELDLARAGGWLAVGGPRSGRTTFLRSALAEAVTALGPDRLHVHVLDHGGGGLAAAVAGLPHAGTAVGRDDALRTVRLLDRLAQEVAARRAVPPEDPPPHLLLLVDGAESVMAQLDESDPGRGSAALLRLVRDGGAAGLTCLLTADRAVPGGRLANAVDTRLVLPLADRADYAVAGVPAGAVPGHRPPGRALVGEDARECQLALPRRLPGTWPAATPGRQRPLSVPELPAAPVLPLPWSSGSGHPLLLPIGPGGDDGGVLTVDLARTGGLLVAGPPGSGRTTALESCARHLATAGVAVLHVVRSTRDADGAPGRLWLEATDVAGWQTWLAELHGAPAAVVVDDSALLADSAVLGALPAAESVPDVVLVVAGTAAELSAAYRGPVPALRRRRSGLLLSPGPGDADLLGIRLPRTPVPARPGSGWLVVAGTAQRVQVARRDLPGSGPVEALTGSGTRGAGW
ncbi:FtsK/SpoIIIE domain-containing protein [Geodermatophilus poikilotrophus]|uniref:DNA segregation ATPase FtsK/SpoIIIE, S-DNA-T family n=1 Tax=Geodermatophilus poikilotrophus TaxID=1333667 RepID=A0A1I0FQE3_9ACTN|nr:FtsK/SpoIIIE domain-containing protein [Geodermatophilus poikilotrophus]SET59736.1 DNA segregation ATPase FtsK/SpoIIIE, S-DNA-T family [Geodermatophilus poikilotrophus]